MNRHNFLIGDKVWYEIIGHTTVKRQQRKTRAYFPGIILDIKNKHATVCLTNPNTNTTRTVKVQLDKLFHEVENARSIDIA